MALLQFDAFRGWQPLISAFAAGIAYTACPYILAKTLSQAHLWLLMPLALLIAAIGYSVTLASTVFDGEGAAMTILVLGFFLVILGAFWARIRATLLSPLAGVLPLHRLPPSH